MSGESVTRVVAKTVLVGLASAIGGLLGLIAVALAHREWVPPPPCRDMWPPRYVGACTLPTAPIWLLAIGFVVGAAITLLAVRTVLSKVRSRAHGHTVAP